MLNEMAWTVWGSSFLATGRRAKERKRFCADFVNVEIAAEKA
jgi:hypothetical protein